MILYPTIMKSQNATATLGDVTSCPGENTLVPLNVMDFNNVGAMTIYISYDTNAAQFLSIENINPAIPGGIAFFTNSNQINIAYSYTEPFFITGEKLFDLSFTFQDDSTNLTFLPGTEIADIELVVIPLDTFPGSISNSITLINQPDSVQSYPDNDVIFRVTATGNITYQWQENSGSVWADLQNNERYSGVTNDTLTINDVPVSFNGNTYRCVLTADPCTVISDPALLEVAIAFPAATLGYISSCPDQQVLEPVLVGDFFDIIEFNFNITYNTEALDFSGLSDVHPDLANGTLDVTPSANPPGVAIHWEDDIPINLASATLFDLVFDYINQDQLISFGTGTYVLNSSQNLVNITLSNGLLTQFSTPNINEQPSDLTVMEPGEAQFSVTATGTEEYHWMLSTDNGVSWNELAEEPPYFNVTTPELTITPSVYDMNGYRFACRLSSEHCTLSSEGAILTVDTLTGISDQEINNDIILFPVPFKDFLTIEPDRSAAYHSVGIYTIDGRECYYNTLLYSNGDDKIIKLNVSSLTPGYYVLQLQGMKHGLIYSKQKKVIKMD